MYKHILIATDGSELATKAAAAGLLLAKKLSSTVTAVTVTEPWTAIMTPEQALGIPNDEYEKATAATASQVLASVVELARKSDVACATVHAKASIRRRASSTPRRRPAAISSSWLPTVGEDWVGFFRVAKP